MKRIYGTAGFLIAILIFGMVVHTVFNDVDLQSLTSQIGPTKLALNVLIGIVHFLSFGWLMKIVYKHHYNEHLSVSDTFFLPFMMHLWTYIIPIKGGLIYQTFFMKAKYKVDMSKGFSVGVLVFASGLLITCFVGGALSFMIKDPLAIQLVLAFMFITLLVFLIGGKLVGKPDASKTGLLDSVIAFIQNVLIQFNEQTKNKELLFKLILVSLFSTMAHATWFYHCAYILGFEPEPAGILLATLVLRIVTLVRILPGNFGVQELMIGSVFMAAGLGLHEGLTTSLLVRLVSVGLAGSLGAGGLYLNFRYFGTDSFTTLIQKLKKSEN